MCGIVGLFAKRPVPELRSFVLRSMGRAAHRGPDGQGLILGRGNQLLDANSEDTASWGLGHVRLAILDLSPAGLQPMASSDRTCWITYNGEVYNYLELRAELESLGHAFHSGTDTEVMLGAYQEWGTECVKRFNGMFAFVIVDLARERVFAARDRLGVKPLYLWVGPDLAALVSEQKQLLDLPGFRAQANRRQVLDFLIDGVAGHEPDLCFFEGVHPIPAGHTLSWGLNETPSVQAAQRYWNPATQPKNLSWHDAVQTTGELFRDAVRIRLRSDVPVGTCLSGGIDSSSIVGVVSRDLGVRVKTFSSCFHHPGYDERLYMDAVNAHCGSDPVKVFPNEEEALSELERLVYHQDEPFSTLSMYAQWCVMRAARQAGVPVLLDGQGGDETLCGYKKYAFFLFRDLIARHRYVDAAVHAVGLVTRGDRGLFNWRTGHRYLPAWLRGQRDSIHAWLQPEWRKLSRRVWSTRMADVSAFHDHQIADLLTWSLPPLLRYEDRSSMAHSVETRLPFVDYRFVEHCVNLPESVFFKRGRTKRLLVEALGDALPDEVRNRRTKMGFEAPLAAWLKGPLGKELEARVRGSERLRPILDGEVAARAFAAYRNGDAGFSDLTLFRIASVTLWLETFQVDV
ncbi:MAG: asparagine synthase (glutamine-hydrolyzing) [Thermodesulfobacteriota bacterium]